MMNILMDRDDYEMVIKMIIMMMMTIVVTVTILSTRVIELVVTTCCDLETECGR